MKDPNSLIAAYLDNALSETERAELTQWLKADPANVRQFTEAVMFEEQLRAAAQTQAAQAATEDFAEAPTRRVLPSWFAGWVSWRPLAAGIIVGIFCASFAWAYVSPKAPKVIKQALPLANAGFEEAAAPSPNGIPTTFGNWSGDYAEVVGAQAGIVPKEGQRMLRFVRSDNAVSAAGAAEAPRTGNIYQVIDLRPWRQALRDSQATADWSAWFHWAPSEGETGMTFAIHIWSFTGSTSILPSNWKDHLYQETAKSGQRAAFDQTPNTWRQLSASMIVPPDTDFLVVELKAIPRDPAPSSGPYCFKSGYVDETSLTLRIENENPSHE